MIETFHESDFICHMVLYNDQLAAVAALCVQYEANFRPNMSIVVKALQPLLNPPRSAPQTPHRNPYWSNIQSPISHLLIMMIHQMCIIHFGSVLC